MTLTVKPVFIVGAPRSGTSVTKKIVRRHPGLRSCGIEHHYILEMSDQFGRDRFTFDDGLEAFRRSASAFDIPELAKPRSTQSDNQGRYTVPEFCATIWRLATGDDLSRPLLLQYAGVGILRAPELIRLFPAARFIVLTRDPRANVSSQLLSLPGSRTTNRSIALWKECRRAADDLTDMRPDATLDVPYEGLVLDTEKWLREIVSFIGIPWDQALLDFEVPMPVVATDGTTQHRRFTGLDPEMIDKWQEGLTSAQTSLVELRCKAEMARLGYDPTGRSIRFTDLPFLVSDTLKWGWAKIASSTRPLLAHIPS